MSEERLVGWLCFIRLHGRVGIPTLIPDGVYEDLEERGWIETVLVERDDGEVEPDTVLTKEGEAKADLESLEWGIDPLEVLG